MYIYYNLSYILYNTLYDILYYNIYKFNYMEFNMKHLVDLEHGSLVLIPESAADRRLLFHLMNCSDLSQFTQYLELEQKNNPSPVTTDLDVSIKNIEMYPAGSEIETEHKYYNIRHKGHLAKLYDHQSDMDFPPDFEFKPLGELVLYNYMLEEEQKIEFRKGTGETFLPVTSSHWFQQVTEQHRTRKTGAGNTGQEEQEARLIGFNR